MILLEFALIFAVINFILLKCANTYLGKEIPEWAENFTINGRKFCNDAELETKRKRVNNRYSKF